jgi:putative serine protease PepD
MSAIWGGRRRVVPWAGCGENMNEPKPTKAKWWSRPGPVPPVVAEVDSAEDAGLSEGGFGPEGVLGPEPDSGHDGDFVLERPLPVPPAADAPSAAVSDAASASADPVDRPGPLHDPDPYSTPPYGQPGPWAAAQPVQHPTRCDSPGPDGPHRSRVELAKEYSRLRKPPPESSAEPWLVTGRFQMFSRARRCPGRTGAAVAG